MSMKITQKEQVNLITEAIFNQYDVDKSGFLDH